ncbi:phosphoribosyl-ATP diphosphatase [Clostridium thermarum]|uniref:phosphoribosyl-ATP diphosphatase n=1 Tax=Clostridium thermarum TaxID=1716543 RepID=UPI0013D8A2A2|nr:phosphoribosyl-ATP diphosphatase [Clostridium thermarum]
MMTENVIQALYQVIQERKAYPMEGSYTNYLFKSGLDKILKKIGEEATEVIVAAKNKDKMETVAEICDLCYHVLVLMAQKEIELNEIGTELEKRRQKIGNKKAERAEVTVL